VIFWRQEVEAYLTGLPGLQLGHIHMKSGVSSLLYIRGGLGERPPSPTCHTVACSPGCLPAIVGLAPPFAIPPGTAGHRGNTPVPRRSNTNTLVKEAGQYPVLRVAHRVAWRAR
jgi:hypothetical protein